MNLMTFDKQSNMRRTRVESKSNRSCNRAPPNNFARSAALAEVCVLLNAFLVIFVVIITPGVKA